MSYKFENHHVQDRQGMAMEIWAFYIDGQIYELTYTNNPWGIADIKKFILEKKVEL